MSIFFQAVVEVLKDIPKVFIWFGKNSNPIGRFVGKVLFVVVPYFGLAGIAISLNSSLGFIMILPAAAWLVFSLAVLIEIDSIRERAKK